MKASMILNEEGNPISLLHLDYIHRMYQFQNLDTYLNKHFLDAFSKENPSLVDINEEWWNEDMSFTTKDNRVY
jgi:hypothetical protein